MVENDAAAQFREYAGIKKGHLDVENKAGRKKDQPVDVVEREHTTVEGDSVETTVDPKAEAAVLTTEPATPKPVKRASKKAAVAKARAPKAGKPAAKTAAKK